MHQSFPQLKKQWWWIESSGAYSRLSENPFAQGYEVLRRVQPFCNELPASYCPPDHTWKQLYRWRKDYFSHNYQKILTRIGLLKTIMAGPAGISFDPSESNYSLLSSLKSHLANPTPFAVGVDLDKKKRFRIAPKFKAARSDEHIYTKRQNGLHWTHGPGAGVYLQLPQSSGAGDDRELNSKEIMAFFRNFIKDNPPPDFAKFRAGLRQKTESSRQEKTRIIALGLLASDYLNQPDAELSDLADWLCKTSRAKNLFSLADDELSKGIYYAKDRVYQLFDQASML